MHIVYSGIEISSQQSVTSSAVNCQPQQVSCNLNAKPVWSERVRRTIPKVSFQTCNSYVGRVPQRQFGTTMAADRVSQIRELWIELASEDDDSSDDEVSNTKRARHASRGISSSSTSSRSKAAGSRQLSSPSPKQRTEERIDTILRFIRGVHGGSFPFFNDDNPDPGCQYEVLCYSRVLDPVFVPEADRNLNVSAHTWHCNIKPAATFSCLMHWLQHNVQQHLSLVGQLCCT